MTFYNEITLKVLTSSGTVIPDLGQTFARYSDLSFETFYPGGIFGECKFTLPAERIGSTYLEGGQIVKLRNNTRLVYEGYITDLQWRANGLQVTCTGPWGYLLGRRYSVRPWADGRMDAQTWRALETRAGFPKSSIDYQNRIMFIPKAVSWASPNSVGVDYYAPPGESIHSVTYTYDLTTAGTLKFTLGIRDTTNSIDVWTVSRTTAGSSTGTRTDTMGSGCKQVALFMRSDDTQTPAADGTTYAKFTGVTVYSTLDSSDTPGTLNLDVLLRDIRAGNTAISADFSSVTSNTYNLAPFIANDVERLTDIIQRAAKFGDSSGNPWGVCLFGSDVAYDNRPIFISEVMPPLNYYNFTVSTREITGTIRRAFDEVYNYIFVKYTDAQGIKQVISPATQPTLTDSLSVSLYGRSDYTLSLRTTSATAALAYGVRFLNAHKYPRIYVDGPITIQGSAIGTNGNVFPACRIAARQRVRIDDFVQDITEQPFIGLIQRTRYTHNNRTVQIWLHQPDELAIELARMLK